MSTIEKRIFTNLSDVTDYLTSIGFTIDNNIIQWSYVTNTNNQCYWKIENDIIKFYRSDGQSAFEKDLVNFDYTETIDDTEVSRPKCAIVHIPLLDNGIAIYMGMITEDTSISNITFCCKNKDNILNNGLVVCSPSEDDGYWYYGWNDPSADETAETPTFYWNLDNGVNNAEYGAAVTQLASKYIHDIPHSFTLTKLYLNTGYWSKNIKCLLTGDLTPPGQIFKINGQKYIDFSSSSLFRAPVYKLSPEQAEQNLSTATDPYSALKTYVKGDYCIYEGYLYKCKESITIPEPFDSAKWSITTVHDELVGQQSYIYGD